MEFKTSRGIPRGNATEALAACMFYSSANDNYQITNNEAGVSHFFESCEEIDMPPEEPFFESRDDDFGAISTLIIETSDAEIDAKRD